MNATPPLLQVELLVMKALSAGLVQARIDEVQQVVHVQWVLPRVLDRDQVSFHFFLFISASTPFQGFHT